MKYLLIEHCKNSDDVIEESYSESEILGYKSYYENQSNWNDNRAWYEVING